MAEAGWTRKECVIYRRLEDVLLAGHRKKIMALRKAWHAGINTGVGILMPECMEVLFVPRVLILEQMEAWKVARLPWAIVVLLTATPPKPKSAVWKRNKK